MNAQIIQELHTQRRSLEADLRDKRASISEVEKSIARVQAAIDALEGKAPVVVAGAKPAAADGPSVGDMIMICAESTASPFDAKALCATAKAKFPDDIDKIRRGVYNAILQLVKRGKLNRCAGGFTLKPVVLVAGSPA